MATHRLLKQQNTIILYFVAKNSNWNEIFCNVLCLKHMIHDATLYDIVLEIQFEKLFSNSDRHFVLFFDTIRISNWIIVARRGVAYHMISGVEWLLYYSTEVCIYVVRILTVVNLHINCFFFDVLHSLSGYFWYVCKTTVFGCE